MSDSRAVATRKVQAWLKFAQSTGQVSGPCLEKIKTAHRSTAAISPAHHAVFSGATSVVEHSSEFESAGDTSVSRLTLPQIREQLGECTRCKLSSTRTHIVFGVGPEPASLMFVGEAPGAEEDRRGEPFVGAAGQLLDKMIVAMGRTRDSVYIANIVKCRPPGNRDPEVDEVTSCLPFLLKQLEAVRPRILVTLGKPAAHAILSSKAPISALRGKFHSFRGIPVMPTFHPAFLLRSPDRKRDAWADLKLVMQELDRLGVGSH